MADDSPSFASTDRLVAKAVAALMPNSVSAFEVSAGGQLLQLPGSPVYTGGLAIRWPQAFLNNRLIVSPSGRFLFVANGGSNDVSVFRIDSVTGALRAIPGSPFATQGDGRAGIVLQATPDERWLFAGHRYSGSISVFRIGEDGALTLADRLGARLYAAMYGLAAGVAAFDIEPDGALIAAPGSPYPTATGNGLMSVAVYPGKSCVAIGPSRSLPPFTACPSPGRLPRPRHLISATRRPAL